MNAIVYTSETGFTEKYARLLGQETGLPVFALADAQKKLAKGSEIIYLGWLMAGGVKGCAKALRQYNVRAVCAVGMARPSEQQASGARARHHISTEVPVFTLQGGFALERLHGIYRLMMAMMAKTVGKNLANKPDKTPEEEEMMELMNHGGDCVSRENLSPVLAWWESQT